MWKNGAGIELPGEYKKRYAGQKEVGCGGDDEKGLLSRLMR